MPRLYLLLWGAVACHHPPAPVTDDLRAAMHGIAEETREYRGDVYALGSDEAPMYRYERHEWASGDARISTHVTSTPEGEPVVVHAATHSPTYALVRFREVQAQRGLVGQVEVGADGAATYTTTVDGRTRTRVEPPGDPLHVGPTLFGHVREAWEALAAGEPLRVRFVVLERRRSYRFVLKQVDGPPGTTTIAMVPTNPLVALALPHTRMVFDPDQRVLTYRGRVPPLRPVGGRFAPLDAMVRYSR